MGDGGGAALQKTLVDETRKEMSKMELQEQRNQKTAAAKAAAQIQAQKIKDAKDKVQQSVNTWQKDLATNTKWRRRTDGFFAEEEIDDDDDDDVSDGEEDAVGDSGGNTLEAGIVDEDGEMKNEKGVSRIQELELLNEDLPSLEALLVDKALNKKFFETTLPKLLTNALVDDDKKQQCITLVRKYKTLQNHVGYGVR